MNAISATYETRTIGRSEKIATFMAMSPIVLDYRFSGNAEASIGVYLVVLAANMIGTAFLVRRFGLSRSGPLAIGLTISAAYLLISTLSGLMSGTAAIDVVRASSSVLVFVSCFASVSALSRSIQRPAQIWYYTMMSAFAGATLQVVIVVVSAGIDLSRVRYEILSGGAPLISAFIVVAFIYGGWRMWSAILAPLHSILIFLSVTRTQIFVAGVLAAGVFIAAPILAVTRRGLYRSAAMVPVLVFALLAFDASLPVSQVERWWSRLVTTQEAHAGIDVTDVTRAGEARYQIDRLAADPIGMLFGYGPAASTQFDERSVQIIASLLGEQQAILEGNGFGHNNYVGTLFVGGLLAGLPMLAFQIVSLIKGLQTFRLLGVLANGQNRTLLLSIPAAVLAYIAFGFLGGTMGGRSSSAAFALSIAMTWWVADIIRTQGIASLEPQRANAQALLV